VTAPRCSEEVADALTARRPVVALETAVITCGLPAAPLAAPDIGGWEGGGPANLEAARLMERTVRAAGAVPAMVAVIDGILRVGLDDRDLVRLAGMKGAAKVSSAALAGALAGGSTAGTTVSATLVACGLTGIEVFATGGLGGVHRGWQDRLDVSADLRQLARTACCVVCSGPKAVLDVPATVEALEALGVPVVGYRTEAMPCFYAEPDPAIPVTCRADEPADVAGLCRARWTVLRQGGAVVLAQPVPGPWAIRRSEIEGALAAAERQAAGQGIGGAEVTPFLLASLAQATAGRTLRANVELLAANAALAGRVAGALAAG
jgi:pseudouridine-5'-phosphate glycosidase